MMFEVGEEALDGSGSQDIAKSGESEEKEKRRRWENLGVYIGRSP